MFLTETREQELRTRTQQIIYSFFKSVILNSKDRGDPEDKTPEGDQRLGLVLQGIVGSEY